ncbi:hypothetical protein ABKV19_009157, partial [Rosa sericea]
MSFRLCNAPATFQRLMISIFHDMTEKFMKVFMDDFSIHGDSFDDCLAHLSLVLARCEETNLVLNWEKCHFMVDEGIVLGHVVSSRGIEVDKAKSAIKSSLPPPTSVKGVRSFLGHAGFYRRFIENFSLISKPLCDLLAKDSKVEFASDCLCAFELLKEIIHQDTGYPFDVLDRFWYVFNDFDYWTQLSSSTNSDVSTTMPSKDEFSYIHQLPFVVMSTASTPKNANGSLNNFWPPEADDKNADYYIYMHFAEVERLQPNQSRQFNIVNGEHFSRPFVPTYFETNTIYNRKAFKGGLNNVTISRAENSSLPPILNAFEIYVLKEFSELETNQEDVGAITNIKPSYKIKRNWQGDPCTPTRYSWVGLNCSYHEDDESPRIISLDLSNNNLTGPIPEFLSQLPNLVHLDLSNNNLTGQISDIFSQLPKLTFRNLEKNKLTGSIPEGLIQRKNNGFLTLRLCENPNLRGTVTCNDKKKENVLLFVAISIVGVSILLAIYAAIQWSFIRKRQH